MVGFAIHLKKKKPEWLEILLQSRFFGPCFDHQELKKSERNVFCMDCNECICQHCLSSSSHYLHKLLQIRRYVYNDVIRLQDMQKHLDCAKVQTYTINNAKVVFLNPRPQSKSSKSNSGASCEICERSLAEPNRYCSLGCKVSATANQSSDQSSPPILSFQIPEFSDLSSSKKNEDQKSNHEEGESSNSASAAAAASAATEPEESIEDENQNKNKITSALLKPKKQLQKRRKGIPHRAPFY